MTVMEFFDSSVSLHFLAPRTSLDSAAAEITTSASLILSQKKPVKGPIALCDSTPALTPAHAVLG